MQRLLASTSALVSDGSSASIAEPRNEAEEDHATIRNVFGSEDDFRGNLIDIISEATGVEVFLDHVIMVLEKDR